MTTENVTAVEVDPVLFEGIELAREDGATKYVFIMGGAIVAGTVKSRFDAIAATWGDDDEEALRDNLADDNRHVYIVDVQIGQGLGTTTVPYLRVDLARVSAWGRGLGYVEAADSDGEN